MTATLTTKIGKHPCGFCATRHHGLCPGSVRNGSSAPVQVVVCPCSESGHTLVPGTHLEAHVERLPHRPLRLRAPSAPDSGGTAGGGATPARCGQRRQGKASAVFPPGVVSPYQFRGVLIAKGLEPASFRPQTVYTWVTQAAKGAGGFPVRYYAPDGTEATAAADGARPGVPVDDGIAWHTARPAAKAA